MYLWCLIILVTVLIIYFYYRKPAAAAGKPLYDWNGVYVAGNLKIIMTGFPDSPKINMRGMEIAPVFVENNMASVGIAAFQNRGTYLDTIGVTENKTVFNKTEGNTGIIGYFQEPVVEDSAWNGKWLTGDGKTVTEIKKTGGKLNFILEGFIMAKLSIEADGSISMNGIKMVLDGDKIIGTENNIVLYTRKN
jgi:hypothetical protein